jgi:hypothetical protein
MPDDRLAEIGVGEPDRAEHGAIGGALDALGDGGAAEFLGALGECRRGEGEAVREAEAAK